MSEHTGSRVHRQSFNHSVERIFLLLFSPLPLSFLFFFLLFLTQPSFREARSARSQLHRAHLGSSSLRLPYPITCPPCKLIYLTRIADTIDARLPYYSAPRGSFAPFHERYRVVVKSTRPVLITTHRSIPQLRSFFLSIPLRSTIFFQPRRVFLFHFSHDDFSDLLASIEP